MANTAMEIFVKVLNN